MAESFGVVAGALGIASTFSACIECFEYIQVGRHADQSLQTQELLLTCVQYRLSSWGSSVNILEDPKLGQPQAPQAKIDLAEATVRHIISLFGGAVKITDHYHSSTHDKSSESRNEVQILTGALNRLSVQKGLSSKSERMGFLKRGRWAFADETALKKLVDGIIPLVERLEVLFPGQTASQSDIRNEIRSIQAQENIRFDSLEDVVRAAAPEVAEAIRTSDIDLSENEFASNVRLNVGSWYSEQWNGQKVGGTDIKFKNNKADEGSKINIGSRYGGKDFWDD